METIHRGGRPLPGFGVGIAPQSTFVRPAAPDGATSLFARPAGKVGAFLGGAVMSGLAGAVATTFFGEGTSVGSLQTVATRLQRNWKVLAATAAAGGLVAAAVK